MIRIFSYILILMVFFLNFEQDFSESQTNLSKFITLKKIGGKWWFQTPDNKPFFSIGICNVTPEDKDVKLGANHYNGLKSKTEEAWAKETITFLTNIGFNTMGSWSSEEIYKQKIPYTVIIEYKKFDKNKLVDIFDAQFEKEMEFIVRDQSKPYINDPNLIGYFVGNDLNWYGDYSFYMGHESYLLDMYFELPGYSAGKKRVIDFMKQKYKDIQGFNNDWGLNLKKFEDIADLKQYQFNSKNINKLRNEFLAIVAERYYNVITEKIRALDKNHLIFSDRFANSVPETVVKISGKYCDAVSINYYKNLPDIDRSFLAALSYYAGKPLIISEFTFRSMDNTSGLLNKVGPDTTVSNQQERGNHFIKYAKSFAELPFIVGYHWFQFFDDPQDGRASDDEDSNYGLVDIYGRLYQPLIKAMRETNPKIQALHRDSQINIQPGSIRLADIISVRKGRKNPDFDSVYLSTNTALNNLITTWGDSDNDARITIQKKKKALILNFNTGTGWGCGISIFPPNFEKTGYYDATGYKGFNIRMSVPQKLKFIIYLNESGVDQVWKKKYPGVNGADGESFSADESYGISILTNYIYNFESFNIRPVWGNQSGNKTIDLQGLNDIELAIPGSQGSGTISIEQIEFY